MVDYNPEAVFQGERPDNFIVGVIDEQSEVEAVIEDLQSRGYGGEHINVLHGEKGAEAILHRGEALGTGSTMQRLRNLLEEFAAGGLDDRRRHVEAAAQGKYVVGVVLPSDEPKSEEEVHQILKSHSGYDIVMVRGGTVELLEE